ncbi:hypothetical protein A5789_34980 [Nocardia sp. 852002-51101_SCH5132738]|nr:hypothetical protein A5789_34980 [Nocardia sp. 852002-51101_SCH5132738]OBB39222.1 hypothetical protein A5748_34550 [Nocardia sp. 852002-51244_SCH5132740]OBF78032.1 hypothetical protein A9X06_23385 [Mycobacterium sp. 852002-51759_SCH5129042]
MADPHSATANACAETGAGAGLVAAGVGPDAPHPATTTAVATVTAATTHLTPMSVREFPGARPLLGAGVDPTAIRHCKDRRIAEAAGT